MYALDPHIFWNWDCDTNSTELVLALSKWINDRNIRLRDFRLAWDTEGLLEAEYFRFLQEQRKDKKTHACRVVNHILDSKVDPYNQILASNLPPDIQEVLSYPLIYQTLISMAVNKTELIVVLSDSTIVTYEMRDKLCHTLGREAILFVSEFNQRLFIRTEGKTDWKHIKASFEKLKQQGKFLGLCLDFDEFEDEELDKKLHKGGDAKLLRFCQEASKTPTDRHIIGIFDRDDSNIVKDVTDTQNLPGHFKVWSANVYSFAIPVPIHRTYMANDICIEFYYHDECIRQKDPEGRRLFISNEFDSLTGLLESDADELACVTICRDLNKLQNPNKISVIEAQVYLNDRANKTSKSIALGKNDFANHILCEQPGFTQFDISAFERIFEIILAIRNKAYST